MHMRISLRVDGIKTLSYVITALTILIIMGCSSGSTMTSVKKVEENGSTMNPVAVNSTATIKTVSTVDPTHTAIPTPLILVNSPVVQKQSDSSQQSVQMTPESAIEVPVSTVTPVSASTKSSPSSVPTIAVSPTASPMPAPTRVVKIETPTPQRQNKNASGDSARSIDATEIYDKYGFLINTSGASDILELSRDFGEPDVSRGMIIFTKQTSRVLLEWTDRSGKSDLEFLADSYRDVKDVSPELVFVDLGEGDISGDSNNGIYGAFSAGKTAEEVDGYGLIGVWGCDENRIFALVVTGSDPTVLQIRFHDLIDSFKCGT
jgi:hypothetical protein